MKDILKQDLEKGDIVAIVNTGTLGWTSTWFGVLDGTFTKGGRPRYFMSGGRRENDYKTKMIKITEEQLRLSDLNDMKIETLLEISRDIKE